MGGSFRRIPSKFKELYSFAINKRVFDSHPTKSEDQKKILTFEEKTLANSSNSKKILGVSYALRRVLHGLTGYALRKLLDTINVFVIPPEKLKRICFFVMFVLNTFL